MRVYVLLIVLLAFCSFTAAAAGSDRNAVSEQMLDNSKQESEREADKTTKIIFEPTIGSWYGTSDDGHWYGAFGELTLWREERDKEKSWSPGLDMIASYSHGRMSESAYKWIEKTVGGGPAIKYADHDPEHPWQWQLKIRVLFEQTDGDDSDKSYKVKQRSILLNPYTEYVTRLTPKWIWGATAEGKIALRRSINSTWSDEVPSNRNTVNAGLFSQYQVNHELQGRLTLSGLYQGWDKKSGVELSPELRIKEIIMFGVKGAIIGGETVVTGFAMIELGKPLRDLNIF